MSRKISFRGYNLKNKKWLYGYYLVNRGKHYIVQDEVVDPFAVPEDFEVDPESVGQKVGEVDGVELYEGDVVNINRKKELFFRGKIMWDSVYCQYIIRNGNYGRDLLSTAKNLFEYEVTSNEYEEKLKISNP